MLTLIPTPIGNLEDITLRALKVLRDADIIACSERASSFMNALLANKLTPKRIKFIYPRLNENSKIFLIECVKNGGEGLIIEPPLIVLDGNNNYTPELLSAYKI